MWNQIMGLTTVASEEANRLLRDHENDAATTKVSPPYGMNDHLWLNLTKPDSIQSVKS